MSSETVGKTITCKAAVMWKTGEPLVVEDVEVAPPKAGEVRVKILATSVCHTDIYNWSGADSETNIPAILGHEGAGVVESIGDGVTSVKVGDHVIPLYTPECGSCKFCTRTGAQRTNLCPKVRSTQGKGVMPDGTTRFKCKGQDVFHFMGCSTFAEYTVLPEVSLAVINKDAPLDRVCLFGCGVTTGYGAVRQVGVQAGATAAVFGLGGVGLAVVMGLREAGARKILAIDLNPAKFELAKQLGGDAVVCVNPLDHPGRRIADVVIEMTTEEGWGGVDFSFECVGSTLLMREALECTHRGWGVSCIIGVAEAGKEISTRPFQLVTGRQWRGTAMGGVKGRSEIPGFVERYLTGEIPLDVFITHRYSGISTVPEAFDVMHSPASNCIRPIVTLSQ